MNNLSEGVAKNPANASGMPPNSVKIVCVQGFQEDVRGALDRNSAFGVTLNGNTIFLKNSLCAETNDNGEGSIQVSQKKLPLGSHKTRTRLAVTLVVGADTIRPLGYVPFGAIEEIVETNDQGSERMWNIPGS